VADVPPLPPGSPFKIMSLQPNVSRRRSDQHFELTWFRHPVFLCGAVESHCAPVEREMHNLHFSGCEIDSAKAFQFLDGAIQARVSICT